jgi:predicted RNase H-like HicB family nuclease
VGAYVSRCPELEVASFGYTPEEALENLKEAGELYLENAEELGLIGTGADCSLNRSQTFSRF